MGVLFLLVLLAPASVLSDVAPVSPVSPTARVAPVSPVARIAPVHLPPPLLGLFDVISNVGHAALQIIHNTIHLATNTQKYPIGYYPGQYGQPYNPAKPGYGEKYPRQPHYHAEGGMVQSMSHNSYQQVPRPSPSTSTPLTSGGIPPEKPTGNMQTFGQPSHPPEGDMSPDMSHNYQQVPGPSSSTPKLPISGDTALEEPPGNLGQTSVMLQDNYQQILEPVPSALKSPISRSLVPERSIAQAS